MKFAKFSLPPRAKVRLHAGSPRSRHTSLAVACLGLALAVYGLFGSWQRYTATHNPRPLPPADQIITTSITQPDETPIPQSADYYTPPDQPRVIHLPSIATGGFIQKVGIDTTNTLVVPSNIHLAGWYASGPKPGDTGLSIIDGHVQGRYEPGVFKRLGGLKPGDTFTVQFGDNSVRTFQVVSVASHNVQDASAALFAKDANIGQQLNLITCGGHYDKNSRQYDQRVIVVSKRI